MKTFEEFRTEVKTKMREYLPQEFQDAEVHLHEVTKNNDTEKWAVVLRRPNQQIAPQIYLEESYQAYLNGASIESELKNISNALQSHMQAHVSFPIEHIQDYQQIKEMLSIQLINKESNKSRLNGAVCRDIENTDLTAVCRLEIPMENGEWGAVLINKLIAGYWDADPDTAFAKAMENTVLKHPFILQNINDIMMGMMRGCEPDTPPNHIPKQLDGYTQYVLSNIEKCNGASAILYPNVLEEIGKSFNGNFFILPSSIHEIILMKDTGELSAVELQRMVMDINSLQVAPEEVLSNQVLFYDCQENTLSEATTKEETAEILRHITESYPECSEHEICEDMERS